MSDATPAKATPAKATPAKAKAKKVAKPKKPADHPKYIDMVKQAIGALKERSGSSKMAIVKYIMANFNVGKESEAVNRFVKVALKSGVAKGALKQPKGTGASGSFRLGEADKKSKAAKKPAAAKPKAKKPKAKKAAGEKKPKAKKPKTPKKKAAAKPKKSPAKKKAAAKPKKSPAKKAAKKTKSPKKAAAKK